MRTSAGGTLTTGISIVCIIVRVVLCLAGFRLSRLRWGRSGIAVLTVHCGENISTMKTTKYRRDG